MNKARNDPARAVFDKYLPARLSQPEPAKAYAPSNIALSKYWGKRDQALNLPLNSSLSISLRDWGTTTRIMAATQDQVWFNGALLPTDSSFGIKVLQFANRFRRDQQLPLRIETENTIPTAAGLASSASGFAALTRALAQTFGLDLPDNVLSMLARLGSGSATRSLWHGFVRWERGQMDDGSDSFAKPLDIKWPEFRIAIIPVDTGPKAHSSRDGMNHTVKTSPLFATWPKQAEADCTSILTAVQEHDFTTLGALAEANALAMHATMMAARPALSYLKPQSWSVLEQLWQARQNGLEAFATMDAGANVKLIFLKNTATEITTLFPQAKQIKPFAD